MALIQNSAGIVGNDFLALMAGLASIPLIIIGLTSFVKIAVVLALLRNALGVQQIPPNMILYSLGFIMTIYVMLPVVMDVTNVIKKASNKGEAIFDKVNDIATPFVGFIEKHTLPTQKSFFQDNTAKLWGDEFVSQIDKIEGKPILKLVFLAPAFLISELTRAFQIGFLLYLPFIVIDLIIANVLLALGMSTLSPVTISLPLKLLLFIGLDGWKRLIEALVYSYAV